LLRNSPEELGFHLLCGGSLKSCITWLYLLSLQYIILFSADETSRLVVLSMVFSLWEVGNYWPKDTAPYLRRLRCLAITFDDLNSVEVNCSLVIIGLSSTVWY
jgi:hypothetical protein